jgi:thioredoxin reductase (NADPH)
MLPKTTQAEVIIVGGGLAGLSAAIYLGRAKRDTLLIDTGKSMARWEPDVQNYLGFPAGIAGDKLLELGRRQAERYGVRFQRDEILSAITTCKGFLLRGKTGRFRCRRLLLATGIFHIPPDIPNVRPCLGRSMFFCKDCDGYRVQNQAIAVYGWTNEAVEYALGMLVYSACVSLVTDGRRPRWDRRHANWMREYNIPVYQQVIRDVGCRQSRLRFLRFEDGNQADIDCLFTTRGDIYLNRLAKTLGARLDEEGQIVVDDSMRTKLPGVYAAGCVTPSNCQMIIAAGHGAVAAQAINRDLFDESLKTHSLHRLRQGQARALKTKPAVRKFR